MKTILILVASLLPFISLAQKAKFYLGSQEKSANASISLCELDLSTGKVALLDTFNNCTGPGYLALSPNKKNLYAVSADNKVNAFKIGSDARLTYQNGQSSEGVNPCHVSVHPSGKMAFVSNYTAGSFTAYTLQPDGEVNPPVFTEQYTGHGPNAKRQEKSHAHFAATTPDGRYVYVADLGGDKLMNYAVDIKSGKLAPNAAQPAFSGKPGSGPRHFVVHPSGKWLFLLNELEATLTACSISKQGVITEIATYPTIPADFKEPNTSAAIHLHPNNKFVYVSNRGRNSISAFKIKADGTLEKVDEQTRAIAVPRDFNFDPSGKFMIVANQSTDNIVVYDVNPATGKLSFRHESISTKLPICVTFL
ncbi:6-phosphogluconolactonase [Dyadobacter sp. CECT 9275]|uniref:6-phosphogluconolactonase n=1 Tax=Dyadobacter helix TaxID=2822344 RepID=A0A916JBW0_9BACT|nr:lactonase family protein [Dyadobacter sp. CECT 9275]CAG4990559.1 6-phosphogluconolactonase [Dyadobacter sp. CECT 9275]